MRSVSLTESTRRLSSHLKFRRHLDHVSDSCCKTYTSRNRSIRLQYPLFFFSESLGYAEVTVSTAFRHLRSVVAKASVRIENILFFMIINYHSHICVWAWGVNCVWVLLGVDSRFMRLSIACSITGLRNVRNRRFQKFDNVRLPTSLIFLKICVCTKSTGY